MPTPPRDLQSPTRPRPPLQGIRVLAPESIMENTYWLVQDNLDPPDIAILRRCLEEANVQAPSPSGQLVPYSIDGEESPSAEHLQQVIARIWALETAWRAQQPVGTSLFTSEMARIQERMRDFSDAQEGHDEILRKRHEEMSRRISQENNAFAANLRSERAAELQIQEKKDEELSQKILEIQRRADLQAQAQVKITEYTSEALQEAKKAIAAFGQAQIELNALRQSYAQISEENAKIRAENKILAESGHNLSMADFGPLVQRIENLEATNFAAHGNLPSIVDAVVPLASQRASENVSSFCQAQMTSILEGITENLRQATENAQKALRHEGEALKNAIQHEFV